MKYIIQNIDYCDEYDEIKWSDETVADDLKIIAAKLHESMVGKRNVLIEKHQYTEEYLKEFGDRISCYRFLEFIIQRLKDDPKCEINKPLLKEVFSMLQTFEEFKSDFLVIEKEEK